MIKNIYALLKIILVGIMLVACGEIPKNEIEISPPGTEEKSSVELIVIEPEQESEPEPEYAPEPESEPEPVQEEIPEYVTRVSEKLSGHWWFGEGGFGFTFFPDGTIEHSLGAIDWGDIEPRRSLNGAYTVQIESDDVYHIEFEMNDDDKSIYEQLFGRPREIQPFTYNYNKDELIFLGLDGVDRPPMQRSPAS